MIPTGYNSSMICGECEEPGIAKTREEKLAIRDRMVDFLREMGRPCTNAEISAGVGISRMRATQVASYFPNGYFTVSTNNSTVWIELKPGLRK